MLIDNTNQERNETEVDLELTEERFGVERMIDKVANPEGKSPIVATVLEQIHDGHGRMRESMNKESLEDSLHIMDGPTNGGNPAQKGTLYTCHLKITI